MDALTLITVLELLSPALHAQSAMSLREHSIVLLGATGFTGRFVLQELLASSAGLAAPLAVAGRNGEKLRQLLLELGATNQNDVKVRNP